MKKILIVHTKYRNLGGEDIAVNTEANELSKHFDVDTLIFDNSKKVSIFQGLQLLLLNNFESNKELSLKIKNFKPDIVYVHNTWFAGGLGLFKTLDKYKNIKVIIKIHNFRFSCTRTIFYKKHLEGNDYCMGCGAEYKKFKIFNKYFSESVLKSIFVLFYGKQYLKILMNDEYSKFVLTDFQKQFLSKFGINDNIFVQRNFLDSSEKLDYNEYNPDSDYIVYSGRVSTEKGIEFVIDAFLSLKNPTLRLKIVGGGPIFNKIYMEYESFNNIDFIGPVTNKESLKLIRNARAVVSGTFLYEGQPTVLTEAMSNGVPTIFPDNGGISEYYPKNNQFIFKNKDKKDLISKLSLLENRNTLKTTSQKCHENIYDMLNNDRLIKLFSKNISIKADGKNLK